MHPIQASFISPDRRNVTFQRIKRRNVTFRRFNRRNVTLRRSVNPKDARTNTLRHSFRPDLGSRRKSTNRLNYRKTPSSRPLLLVAEIAGT